MRRGFLANFSSLFLIFAFLNFTVVGYPAAVQPENKMAGKIFDSDHHAGLADAVVRIVEMKTGAALEDKTDKNGCYDFDKVPIGNYSVTVSYKGKDYLFADKIQIITTGHEKNVFKRCFGLNSDLSLTQMKDKDCDLCKKFPLVWIIIGGGAAGAIAGVVIGTASPSTP